MLVEEDGDDDPVDDVDRGVDVDDCVAGSVRLMPMVSKNPLRVIVTLTVSWSEMFRYSYAPWGYGYCVLSIIM